MSKFSPFFVPFIPKFRRKRNNVPECFCLRPILPKKYIWLNSEYTVGAFLKTQIVCF